MPNVNTHEELASVLREVRAFPSDREMVASLDTLRQTTQTGEVGVGIKRVLLGVETARQTPEEMVERFADVMAKTMASSRI